MARVRSCWFHDPALVLRMMALRDQGASFADLARFLAERGWGTIHLNSLRSRLAEVRRGQTRYQLQEPSPPVRERVDFLEDREERLSLRAMRTAEARWERAVTQVAKRVEALPVPTVDTTQRNHWQPNRMVVALLSDLHAGQLHPAQEMGTRLAYTPRDLEDRFARWLSESCRFIGEQAQVGNLEHLALFGLGDYVENSQMRQIQALNSSHTTVESAIHAANLISNAIATWESLYPCPISVDLLSGNHDRVGTKGDYRHYESWAMVISALIAARFAGHGRVKVQFHATPSALLGIGRWKFLLDHGDKISPGNRQTGMENRARLLQGLHRQRVDLLCTAHIHSPASWIDPYGTRIVVNGAFADTSPYAMEELGAVSPGTQKILAMDRMLGLVAERDIILRPSPLEPTPVAQRAWVA